MKFAIKYFDWLALFGAIMAGLALVLMFGLGLAEIIMREVFSTSLPISLEYTGYLVAFSFLWGSGWTFRQGKHIRLSLFKQDPEKSKTWETLVHWLALIVAGILTVGVNNWVIGSFQLGSVSFFPSATPLWIPQALFALGPVILVFSIFASLIELTEGKDQ